MTLGGRLKLIRTFLGFTQDSFSKKLKLSQGNLSSLEAGKKKISLALQKNLVIQFQINLHWLLMGDGTIFLPLQEESSVLHIILQNWKSYTQKKKALDEEWDRLCASLFSIGKKPDFLPSLPPPPPVPESFIPDEGIIHIPLFGQVAAGEPIDIYEACESLAVPASFLKGCGRVIAVTIKGDSMIHANINDGDRVLIELCREKIDGAILLIQHLGQMTLKRYRCIKGQDNLFWENGEEKTIQPDNDEWLVVGRYLRAL